MRIVLLSVVALASACGGTVEQPYAPEGPPPEVVQAMTAPETPYSIIYHPPVWLGKEGTEPGARRRGR